MGLGQRGVHREGAFITDTPVAQYPSPEWDGVRGFENLMLELEGDIRRVLAWTAVRPRTATASPPRHSDPFTNLEVFLFVYFLELERSDFFLERFY